MKYRDENGIWQELYLPPTGDTLPIGAEVDYDGEDVPYGWEEVEEPKDVYSETETKTNKVWIDGKPIYRKVLDITNISASGNQYNHNISNLETLVDVYGSWHKTGAGRQPLIRSLPATDGNNAYGVSIGDVANTNFRLHYGTNVTGVTHIYVIFEYTKTTDQGSGS